MIKVLNKVICIKTSNYLYDNNFLFINKIYFINLYN